MSDHRTSKGAVIAIVALSVALAATWTSIYLSRRGADGNPVGFNLITQPANRPNVVASGPTHCLVTNTCKLIAVRFIDSNPRTPCADAKCAPPACPAPPPALTRLCLSFRDATKAVNIDSHDYEGAAHPSEGINTALTIELAP
jgi:hypothetical protein